MASSKPYKRIPKTGLAACMRNWMQARSGSIGARRFFSRELYEALGIPPGHTREKARNALRDFVARGEVIYRLNKKRNRRHFSYNWSWYKTQQGVIKKKMLKAMYVLGSFSMSDIGRLADIKDRHWIARIMRLLQRRGYLQQISRRLCAHGSGVEKVYRVLRKDEFKLEFLQ